MHTFYVGFLVCLPFLAITTASTSQRLSSLSFGSLTFRTNLHTLQDDWLTETRYGYCTAASIFRGVKQLFHQKIFSTSEQRNGRFYSFAIRANRRISYIITTTTTNAGAAVRHASKTVPVFMTSLEYLLFLNKRLGAQGTTAGGFLQTLRKNKIGRKN